MNPKTVRRIFAAGGSGLLALLLVSCGRVTPPSSSPVVQPPAATSPAVLTPTQLPPSVTPVPSSTATLTPILPTLTPSPTPTPILRQLTSGGCCVQPFWSPDSQQVLFLDKPSEADPVGIWGIGLEGGAPRLVTDKLGIYSPDMGWRAFPEGGQTVVEQLPQGERYVIPAGGRSISFSPDGTWVAWTVGQSGPPYDTNQRQVWVSRIDGSQAQKVETVYGGGLAGWFPDGRLLLSGKRSLQESNQSLWTYSFVDQTRVELARAERLRGGLISPGGSWVAYQVTFASQSEENGLWLVNTKTLERRRLGMFGAFRWRDDSHLLIVPLDLSQPQNQLWQVEADSGEAQAITDPAVTPFKISNGDWSVSPDGRWVVFLSAEDGNLWLVGGK